jgi:tRNA U34 2-thiouridine synthase MnmA/TrmU
MTDGKKIKAICLLSGGLDSSLALSIVKDQGVEVVALNFRGPFGGCTEVRDSAAHAVATSLGVSLVVLPLEEDYLEIVKAPSYGYGSNVNPCIDCHIYMLRRAGEMLEREGASFVVTGEVLGQRPMSQRLDTLRRIEKASGLVGYLLRPLSARLLEETIPEAKGWVKREDLLAISGRSRKEQIRLAGEKGLRGFSSPAGGCLLTDPRFALRVRDLFKHDSFTLYQVALLRIGRHFRLPLGSKLVIGRNQAENEQLEQVADPGDVVLITQDCPGPTAVLSGPMQAAEADLAASMIARYSDGKLAGLVKVKVISAEGVGFRDAAPLDPRNVSELMI